jgi:hypothetical protein
VRLIRRVVRLSKAKPNRLSIKLKCRLTAAVETPCSREAALKDPDVTRETKNSKSAAWIKFLDIIIINLRLTID